MHTKCMSTVRQSYSFFKSFSSSYPKSFMLLTCNRCAALVVILTSRPIEPTAHRTPRITALARSTFAPKLPNHWLTPQAADQAPESELLFEPSPAPTFVQILVAHFCCCFGYDCHSYCYFRCRSLDPFLPVQHHAQHELEIAQGQSLRLYVRSPSAAPCFRSRLLRRSAPVCPLSPSPGFRSISDFACSPIP